ncbi:hypothetical protein [Comamonas sp. 4034]|uniref:hypothetical protein n=1 Tax=Comamonas sp. 4034 TaxID=3156455 RepID=UPI003D1D99C2
MNKALASFLALLGIHRHLSAEQKQDLVGAVYQTTPGAVTAGGFRLAQMPLSEWLILSSIGFIILQAAYLVWKWRRDYRRDEERQQDRLAGKRLQDTDLGELS